MKKQFFAALCLFIAFTSCKKKEKNYQYVEITVSVNLQHEKDTAENKMADITASSDSAAYLEAFKYYCMALKKKDDIKKYIYDPGATPIGFKLLDEKGKDITGSVVLANPEKSKQAIFDTVYAMPNQYKKSFEKDTL